MMINDNDVSSTDTACAWTEATAEHRSSQRFMENAAITTDTVGQQAEFAFLTLNRPPEVR